MAIKGDKSAFAVQPKGLLKKQTKTPTPAATAPASEPKTVKKKAKRVASPTLQITVSPDEMALIKEKAGIASISSYLRHVLETQTDVLKKS